MTEKRVDESWKSTVEKEKGLSPEDTGNPAAAEPAFPFFISSLSAQALAALGLMPDPATQEVHTHLEQARYIIDVLRMLAEKTKGNLSADEDQMLRGFLYDLEMKFVEKSGK